MITDDDLHFLILQFFKLLLHGWRKLHPTNPLNLKASFRCKYLFEIQSIVGMPPGMPPIGRGGPPMGPPGIRGPPPGMMRGGPPPRPY